MRKRSITKDDALKLLLEEVHWNFDDTADCSYDPRPHSVGRVEVGWLFEFRPRKQFDADGKKLMSRRYIFCEQDHSVHPVGTFPVSRIVDDILGRGFR